MYVDEVSRMQDMLMIRGIGDERVFDIDKTLKRRYN